MAQTVKNLPVKQETQVLSLSQDKPREGNWQPTPTLVPENSMDRCAWRTAVHGIAKSQT